MPAGSQTEPEDDTFTPEPPKTPETPPARAKFPPSLVAQARRAGLTTEDVEWCETVNDLINLIDAAQAEIRTTQTRQAEPEKPAAKAEVKAEADEEYQFENDLSWADESIQKELKKLGKELLKAKKGRDLESVSELKKEIETLKAEREEEKKRNHPLFKRFIKKVAKHSDLFGEGEDEPAGTAERARYDALLKYLSAEGRLTNSPEDDVDKAITALFKGYGPKPGKTAKELEWDQAGQAPATNRNGAAKTGVPGGTTAAKKKVAERMRLNGQDPGPIDDDEDDDI